MIQDLFSETFRSSLKKQQTKKDNATWTEYCYEKQVTVTRMCRWQAKNIHQKLDFDNMDYWSIALISSSCQIPVRRNLVF